LYCIESNSQNENAVGGRPASGRTDFKSYGHSCDYLRCIAVQEARGMKKDSLGKVIAQISEPALRHKVNDDALPAPRLNVRRFQISMSLLAP
jgi:hypothetical protein